MLWLYRLFTWRVRPGAPNRRMAEILCLAVASTLPYVSVAAEGQVVTLVRSAAPDWPQWRGPQRDGLSEETGLLPSWPADGPQRLWTVSGIGSGYSSPIVVEETIYITGDQGDELLISAISTDGSLRWRKTNGAAWKGSYPGSRSSCTYDEGRLFHMNAHGRLVCLDAATGTEVWEVNVLERFAAKNITWGISESVLVHDDHVFVTPAGAKGLMAALDKRTGATVWTTPPLDLDGVAGERAWSADLKVAHGGLVCVDGRLFGASSSGAVKGWAAIAAATGSATGVSDLPSGSVICADKRFYCLTERGTMTLQEMTADGFKTTGSFPLARGQDVWAHPVICRGNLLLRCRDTLYCYDLRR